MSNTLKPAGERLLAAGGDVTIVSIDQERAAPSPMTVRAQYAALVRWHGREFLRTRSALLAMIAIGLVYVAAAFMAGLAVTDVAAQHVVFYAGLVRPVLVLLFALAVIVALVRDLDDRILDTLLARPLARRTWYLARLTSQLLTAALLAGAAALPLVPLAATGDLAIWTVSLACELALVGALALACATSLGQVATAFGAVAGFYALGRVIAASLLLSRGATVNPTHPLNRVIAWGLAALAHLLPDFSRYTQTSWLVYGAAGTDLLYVGAQSLLYIGLLAALALVAFERRNL